MVDQFEDGRRVELPGKAVKEVSTNGCKSEYEGRTHLSQHIMQARVGNASGIITPFFSPPLTPQTAASPTGVFLVCLNLNTVVRIVARVPGAAPMNDRHEHKSAVLSEVRRVIESVPRTAVGVIFRGVVGHSLE